MHGQLRKHMLNLKDRMYVVLSFNSTTKKIYNTIEVFRDPLLLVFHLGRSEIKNTQILVT